MLHKPSSNRDVKRCLIVASGMYANKGDQAIMEVSKRLYTQFLPNAQLSFESPFPGIKSSIRSMFNIWRQDAVLLNVGHPIQDTTSWLYIPSVFWRLFLGVIAGKDVGMMAGGVSDVKSGFLRWWVTWILNRSVIVSVRDKESAERLQRWGVTRPVIIAADPAFLLCPAQTTRATTFLQGLPPRPVVGLAPRRWFHYQHSFLPVRGTRKRARLPEQALQYQKALTRAIDYVIEELESIVVLISMKPGDAAMPGQDDDVFSSELLDQVKHPEYVFVMPKDFSPGEIKYCFGSFELVVGVRMHSTILALDAGIPCINIYYNEKGLSLFQSLGLSEYVLAIEHCTAQALVDLVKKIWLDRDQVREKITFRLPELEAKVQLPYQYLAMI